MEHFFATCPRGLETVLASELSTFAAKEIVTVDGGVQFLGPFDLCYAANLKSRIASRVLWQVARAPYRDEQDIYDAARALAWREWFGPDRSIRVNLAAIRSPLKSLDYATLRIKDAICDAFRAATGRRPNVDTSMPDVRIHAFLSADAVTFYLDTSGDALFKRGYRRESGEAPIRENLAAGILRLCGWTPEVALLDPMCGSGTFLCEAAMIACRIAPGLSRSFGFEKLNRFERKVWQALREQTQAERNKSINTDIYGSDRYGDVLKLARANLASLGLEHAVQLKQANVLEMPPPISSGIIVTNPPYGVRLHEGNGFAEFYPQLGDALKKKFSGWTAYILSADMRLPKLIGLKASKRTPLFNGALECRLFEYKVVSGSMRKSKADV